MTIMNNNEFRAYKEEIVKDINESLAIKELGAFQGALIGTISVDNQHMFTSAQVAELMSLLMNGK